MKKYILIFLILVLLLPGCRGAETKGDIGYLADAKFDTDEYLPEYDFDESKYWAQGLTRSGNTTLFVPLAGAGKSMFLNYYDSETGAGGILCNKPECTHNDSTCNGYGDFDCISCYDGYIWWSGYNPSDKNDKQKYLWRADASGANRKKMFTLERLNTTMIAYIHRGYYYALESSDEIVEGVGSVGRIDLFAYRLDGSEKVLIYSNSTNGWSETALNLKFSGNFVYYYFDRKNSFDIYRFDTKTRTTEEIALLDREKLQKHPRAMYVTRNNEIYLYGAENKKDIAWKLENGELIPLVTFDDPDGRYNVMFMTDDAVGAMRINRAPAVDSCWVKKYDGTTVYKLDMVSDYVENTIRKDNAEAYNSLFFACGDENRFYLFGNAIEKDKQTIRYLVMYEYSDGKLASRLLTADATIFK